MSEPTDHTLALLRRMDAKLDRLQGDVTDLRGRLQRVEGRLTSVDARLGVLETFDGEVARIDRRLDAVPLPRASARRLSIAIPHDRARSMVAA